MVTRRPWSGTLHSTCMLAAGILLKIWGGGGVGGEWVGLDQYGIRPLRL